MATQTTDVSSSRFGQWAARKARRTAIGLAVALVLVVGIRGAVAQTFTAPVGFMLPEIPAGSHALVWKLGSAYQPGQIIVYRDAQDQAMFGRVVQIDDRAVTVTRGVEPDVIVQRAEIVGRVIVNTR